DFVATFQNALVDILVEHTLEALEIKNQNKLVLAGGVAANSQLRKIFTDKSKELDFSLYLPELKYCTDNAAMIASQGYFHSLKKEPDSIDLNASAMLDLAV
ncbi:MAG: hypothetical protein GX326_04200, partial [Clostridiaceae bacterium]|nr:hypothetical protein [Clostridiaceae bacterium]